MSIASSWLAAPPADAAIELAPEMISAAAISARGAEIAVRGFATRRLAPGALVGSLTAANVLDRRLVIDSLREVVGALGTHPRRVALLLPDVAARVSLVRFERVPARQEDLEQLVRWQLRKSAPFPIDEAVLSLSRGGARDAAGEFVAVIARRAVVRDYETLCEELGMQPGLVDLSTFGVLNFLLSSPSIAGGDWLVVHLRPEYTSLAIMRNDSVIFFRNVPDSDGETLADAVHQTTMYYQDRLSGHGFGRVFLGGTGPTSGSLEAVKRGLEQRLGVGVRSIDLSHAALSDSERIAAAPERLAVLAPLVGTLLRTRGRVAA
jgi:Tfp pilus assembly PilM family ATPase